MLSDAYKYLVSNRLEEEKGQNIRTVLRATSTFWNSPSNVLGWYFDVA